MVGLLLGLLLVVQPPDSVDNNVPVLHDSLRIAEDGHINLLEFENWKFKTGDDLAWASPGYDDSDWHAISSPLEITDSLFHEIGWFRLTFKVDSSFSNEPHFLNYTTFGASELYVNGDKIAHVGNPSSDPNKEKLQHIEWWSTSQYLNPIDVEPGEHMVVAIRYSLHDDTFFKTFSIGDFELIQLTLNIAELGHLEPLIKEGRQALIAFLISSIILFMVMILHLAMHFRFKDEKGNFWIFLISLLIFFSPFVALLNMAGILESQKVMQLNSLTGFLRVYLPISLIPICLGRLLEVEINKSWFFLALYPFVDLLADIIYQGNTPAAVSGLIIGVIGIIVAIGAFNIIREAQKKNQKYLWLITGSLFSYPAMFLTAFLLFTVFSFNNLVLVFFTVILLFTTLPIGFSVYQILRLFSAHGNLQEEVKRQTAELEEAYKDLQDSLNELKSTQQQLVQQEKLASLGQLTAGIAHEIKNPLNFVNNFSDLSVELVEEAREELSDYSRQLSGNGEQVSEISDLLDDIEANLKKINEHGSRADGIVKSMLQHSRGGDGEIEPTDLNALIEEYVNLAFHGMRAGENPINVDIEMDLDEKVGEVPLIAEDFSRVIINLCNNAFDAMRKKQEAESYEPKLTVRTFKDNGQVKIEIEDNGPGIPDDVRDKILQPFFTTKKGTEGTGLGLSITNDIVKAHGGSIEIDSKEGTGARFQLTL